MRTILKAEYGSKDYIREGELTSTEITEILKIRLHMIEVNENYRKEQTSCQFCLGNLETTEHVLLHCLKTKMIRNDIVKIRDVVNFEDPSTHNVIHLLKIYERLKKIKILDRQKTKEN